MKGSLYTCLRDRAVREPGKVLLAEEGRTVTAGETLALVQGTAEALAALGIRPGDLAALRCTRRVDTVVALLALVGLGAVAVLTDPHQGVEDFLRTTGAAVPALWTVSDEGGTGWTVTRREDGGRWPLALVPGDLPLSGGDPHTPAVILFTSGSTGAGKAVVLSQANLIADLTDTQPLGDYRADDIALGVIPLEHVFGLVLLVGVLVLGYRLYLLEKPHIPAILRAVQDCRVTRMNAVPTLYLGMAAQREGYDLSSLRCGFIGGGPCTARQLLDMEAALGMTLLPAYGMTECVGISCASFQDPRPLRASGVGRLYPTVRAKFLHPDGTEALPGEAGELWVDGPTRMLGYYGGGGVDPAGFVDTGDLGYVDACGILHITGRKKDIIIRGGVNLSARRIEEALLSLPGIREAAVVAMPHPALGEVPWAAVTGAAPDPEDLPAALAPLLQRNELPERVIVLDRLPATSSGKPDKTRLRMLLEQATDAAAQTSVV